MIRKFIILILSASVAFAGCNAQPQTAAPEIQAGFLYVSEPADGLQMAHESARLELEDRNICKTHKAVSSPENAAQSVQQLKNAGCSVVFLCDYGYEETAKQLADSYPDIQFVMLGECESAANLYCFTARLYQAYFLAGMAAGSKTESGRLGFVASIGGGEAVRSINAFALGAQLTRPGAKVLVEWTNSYSDSVAAANVSEALIAQHCDVLADGQYSAGAAQSAERYGAYLVSLGDVGRNSDHPYLIGGVEWSLANSYRSIIESINAGIWSAQNTQSAWLSMAEGAFDFMYYNIDDETVRQNIDSYKTAITEANYNVFTGPIRDVYGNVIFGEGSAIPDEDLLLMLWFVEGVEGTVPQG